MQGIHALAEDLGCSVKDADRESEAFKNAMPGLKAWQVRAHRLTAAVSPSSCAPQCAWASDAVCPALVEQDLLGFLRPNYSFISRPCFLFLAMTFWAVILASNQHSPLSVWRARIYCMGGCN